MIVETERLILREMNLDYFDLPVIAQDFLSYMDTIKGKSSNTIKEYYYDLRSFFRFLKLHYKLVPTDIEFDSIEKIIRDKPHHILQSSF